MRLDFQAKCFLACAAIASLGTAARAQVPAPPQPSPVIVQTLGIAPALAQLTGLASQNQGESANATVLREQVLERVLVASLDVDDMLGRIDAEAAHVTNSRLLLESKISRRNTELNIATFAISGALGAAGSAMELTAGLSHAGNALSVASSGTALLLSTVQLKGHGTDKRVLLSPYNMLAEILGQTPNARSRYPPLAAAYLHSPISEDGQLTDGVAPDASLPAAWQRLHLLQSAGGKAGASVASVTTDVEQGRKLHRQRAPRQGSHVARLGGCRGACQSGATKDSSRRPKWKPGALSSRCLPHGLGYSSRHVFSPADGSALSGFFFKSVFANAGWRSSRANECRYRQPPARRLRALPREQRSALVQTPCARRPASQIDRRGQPDPLPHARFRPAYPDRPLP